MKKLSNGKREELLKELDENLLAHITIAMGEWEQETAEELRAKNLDPNFASFVTARFSRRIRK
jgi:uncharacterized membrane protein